MKSIDIKAKSRQTFTIAAGNMIQASGIVSGCLLLWLAAQASNGGLARSAMLLASYLLLYFSTHSIMHYLVGRAVGIQFTHYSLGGSTHAGSYPPVMRQLFERLPFFAAHTDRASLRAARPAAKRIMYAAGILGTLVFCTLAALFAYRAGIPGSSYLLLFNLIWQISSLIAEVRLRGDLSKALGGSRVDRS
jgi:hypothetical protein